MNETFTNIEKLSLVSLLFLTLAACGGGGGPSGGGSAPSALSYPSPVQATVNTAIAPVTPSVTGTVTSYSVSPALPAGVSLDTSSGVISGTPTATAAQSTYTITAMNAYGGTTFDLSLTVNPAAPSALSYTSPVQATVGTPITPLSPAVTGAVTSFAVSPALPAGLSLNTSTGVISGTPTSPAAQANYIVTATNTSGSVTFSLSLTVAAPALVSVTVTPVNISIAVGSTQQFTATVTGTSNTAVTWSVNDVIGGNAIVGLISSTGLYTAPGSVPTPGSVTVTSTSVADPSNSASAIVTITQTSQSLIQITSLDKASAVPFSRLVISGTGFDPTVSAISVLFIPRVAGLPIAVPVYGATTTRLETVIPPLMDPATGLFTSGSVDVQVVQVTPSSVMTSNAFSDLEIAAMPSVDAAIPKGALTRAYLKSALIVLSGVRASVSSNAPLIAALNALSDDQTALLTKVDAIVSDPTLKLDLITNDGNPFTLDAATLASTDQLILAYLVELVPQLEGAPAILSSSRAQAVVAATNPTCLHDYQDPFTDDFICRRQTYEQELATKSVEAWQFGAKLEMGYYVGFMGGWMVSSAAEAGVLLSSQAKGLQLLWTATTPYVMSYLTVTPTPPLSDSLLKTGARLLDTAVFDGIPVTSSCLTAFTAYSKAAAIAASPGMDPHGGIIVSASSTPQGTRAGLFFSQLNSGVQRISLSAIQQSIQINDAVLPPPVWTYCACFFDTSSPDINNWTWRCHGTNSATPPGFIYSPWPCPCGPGFICISALWNAETAGGSERTCSLAHSLRALPGLPRSRARAWFDGRLKPNLTKSTGRT